MLKGLVIRTSATQPASVDLLSHYRVFFSETGSVVDTNENLSTRTASVFI